MSNASPPPPPSDPYLRRLINKTVNSWEINKIVGAFPAVGWAVRHATRIVVRRQIDAALPAVTRDTSTQTSTQNIAQSDLNATLKGVVTDVVQALGYTAAMVATYATDDSLTIQAYYADPQIADEDKIRQWERQLSNLSGLRLSLTDPEIARVYVHHSEYQNNLSVRAFKSGRPERDLSLLSLFTPVIPEGKPLLAQVVRGIQEELGVQEVIAVPFFIEFMVDGHNQRELVGNLFALSRTPIQTKDEDVLLAFGRQVAAALLSERRRRRLQALQGLVFDVQASLDNEQQILDRIVTGVVTRLDYVAAMVATYELDDSLPVRAYYVDPAIATDEQIRQWEEQISTLSGIALSLTNPNIARVYVKQKKYEHNLSVIAYHKKEPVRSPDLFSLFRPIVPEGALMESVVRGIQEELGIRQVIAVPFFLERIIDNQTQQVLVGNLFALSRSPYFTVGEVGALRTFGQQAAAGLRNARLYRQAEARRKSAEIFGKMAFNAATTVHDLTNHVGIVRMRFNSIIKSLDRAENFPEQLLKDIKMKQAVVKTELDKATKLLKNLHEPWRMPPDESTDINACLSKAIEKLELEENPWLHFTSEDLPEIYTSPAMLSEAFRVIVKNAVEAMKAKDTDRGLWIRTTVKDSQYIEVTIRDSGTGIKPENLSQIFEMGWSTKAEGLGYGLFWTKDFIEEGLKGRLYVESEWQKGTTFRIEIPYSTRTTATPLAITAD